jgi:hypothetical protein
VIQTIYSTKEVTRFEKKLKIFQCSLMTMCTGIAAAAGAAASMTKVQNKGILNFVWGYN